MALFSWMAEKFPRPHIQSATKVCHLFLPNVSYICSSLSTPTSTTLVQDLIASCLGCWYNSLLLFLPLASPSTPTQDTTIQADFVLLYSLPCTKISHDYPLPMEWNPAKAQNLNPSCWSHLLTRSHTVTLCSNQKIYPRYCKDVMQHFLLFLWSSRTSWQSSTKALLILWDSALHLFNLSSFNKALLSNTVTLLRHWGGNRCTKQMW